MSMDIERRSDGRSHIALGPVERWVVGVAAAALVTAMGWFANSITTRLDNLAEAQSSLKTQQAVANQQLLTLSTQLANVPELTRQMAEIKVQVDRNSEDIKELRSTRNLK